MQAGANPDSTSHGCSLFRATLSALLCMTLIAGCTETAKPPAPKKADKGKAVAQKGVLGQVAEFSLTDQNASDFTRKDLDGKVWIATFIFTRCTLT
ncbi:MAG: SCO family protein, partial [Planctomycetaceae bacterium]|nr:SCO family protein [Planctomycetaceae bacterium]